MNSQKKVYIGFAYKCGKNCGGVWGRHAGKEGEKKGKSFGGEREWGIVASGNEVFLFGDFVFGVCVKNIKVFFKKNSDFIFERKKKRRRKKIFFFFFSSFLFHHCLQSHPNLHGCTPINTHQLSTAIVTTRTTPTITASNTINIKLLTNILTKKTGENAVKTGEGSDSTLSPTHT